MSRYARAGRSATLPGPQWDSSSAASMRRSIVRSLTDSRIRSPVRIRASGPARSRHGVARPLLGAPELRVLLGAEPPQHGLGGRLDRVGRDELALCHGAPEPAPDRHVIGQRVRPARRAASTSSGSRPGTAWRVPTISRACPAGRSLPPWPRGRRRAGSSRPPCRA